MYYVVAICPKKTGVQLIVNRIVQIDKTFDLKINIGKTKLMKLSPQYPSFKYQQKIKENLETSNIWSKSLERSDIKELFTKKRILLIITFGSVFGASFYMGAVIVKNKKIFNKF